MIRLALSDSARPGVVLARPCGDARVIHTSVALRYPNPAVVSASVDSFGFPREASLAVLAGLSRGTGKPPRTVGVHRQGQLVRRVGRGFAGSAPS